MQPLTDKEIEKILSTKYGTVKRDKRFVTVYLENIEIEFNKLTYKFGDIPLSFEIYASAPVLVHKVTGRTSRDDQYRWEVRGIKSDDYDVIRKTDCTGIHCFDPSSPNKEYVKHPHIMGNRVCLGKYTEQIKQIFVYDPICAVEQIRSILSQYGDEPFFKIDNFTPDKVQCNLCSRFSEGDIVAGQIYCFDCINNYQLNAVESVAYDKEVCVVCKNLYHTSKGLFVKRNKSFYCTQHIPAELVMPAIIPTLVSKVSRGPVPEHELLVEVVDDEDEEFYDEDEDNGEEEDNDW